VPCCGSRRLILHTIRGRRVAWQAVLVAGGFDDPGQHQVPEHLIALGCLVEAERVIGAAQPILQMPIRDATIRNGPDDPAASRPRSSTP
jgi:hypothetical protein